jgi:hypothetical protein
MGATAAQQAQRAKAEFVLAPSDGCGNRKAQRDGPL